jgi:hypothetical protein
MIAETTAMKTTTVSVLPMMKALGQAVLFMTNTQQLPENWHQEYKPINKQQEVLMQQYASQHKDLSKFTQEELGAWASKNHEDLNKILESKDFQIRLEKFDPRGFGMLSILDMKTQWKQKGEKHMVIRPGDGFYKGAKITGKDTYSVFESKNHAHPIAALHTKSGDTVYLTEATEQKDGFELLDLIRKIKSDLKEVRGYAGVTFPIADVDHKADVSWLKNMGLADDYFIDQAMQQTKFKLDQEGAKVKSTFAASVSKCLPEYVEIKNPYIAWWEKKGVAIPVVAAIVAFDSWQKLGDDFEVKMII